MSKIKNGGLDQYGAEPFEQQQFGTAGVEGVNINNMLVNMSATNISWSHTFVHREGTQNCTLSNKRLTYLHALTFDGWLLHFV